MVNYLGDLVLDSGQGPARGFNLGGRADLVPAFLKFVQTLAVFGPLKVNDNVEFGTDTGAFIVAGLPGINIVQESPTAEYKFTWHSAADTLEAVKPDVLIHNATLMAIVSYWIADGPERFAAPVPPEKTVQMLIEKHQDGFLKAVGQWPFGEGKPQGTAKPNP
jgi:hypothetical protein